MSCYFRHLKDLLGEAGITVAADNRKQVDAAIHEAVGVAYKDCPAAWRRLKLEIGREEKRRDLVRKLREAL